KVSQGMLAEFGPKRVIDTPISELGFTAVGVGAAQKGLRPVIEFMTWNFAVLALDQILNTASKMLAMSGGQISCPIVFRGPNGSAGQLGAQHSTAFDSLYANIPGLKVVSPSNGYDAKGLLKQAIRYEEDPVIFFESEVMYGEKSDVPEEEYYIEIGKADVKKQGRDVTIVAWNKMMKVALGAAAELEKENINAEVIDLRTIRPLDLATILESVKKTNRLVIVEEEWPFASISSEITYQVQKEGFDYLDAPIRRITAADAPLHYAPNLVAAALPDVSRTVKLVKDVMYMKK
ncbi:MAG: pyruvate dehydrogenase complex E1 component subunit beta, partial [Chitinophagaceae bacterium]